MSSANFNNSSAALEEVNMESGIGGRLGISLSGGSPSKRLKASHSFVIPSPVSVGVNGNFQMSPSLITPL